MIFRGLGSFSPYVFLLQLHWRFYNCMEEWLEDLGMFDFTSVTICGVFRRDGFDIFLNSNLKRFLWGG